MIKLQRARTEDAIPASLRGRARVEKCAALLRAQAGGRLRFTSANSFWKAAKPQLKRESHGKCAYCEAPTDTVAHGDVEHFRPKSVYWWLAYCYDNYCFSCQICNQQFKGDSFPVAAAPLRIDPPLPADITPDTPDADVELLAGRLAPDPLNDADGLPLARFLAAAAAERPDLVDPYAEDPEALFGWEADAVLREVRLVARNRTKRARRAAAASAELLGLNREELRRERWRVFHVLDTFRQALSFPGVPDALRATIREELRAMVADDAPYAGMARFFVGKVWQLEIAEAAPVLGEARPGS